MNGAGPPGGDGSDLMKALRAEEQTRNLAVVVMTGIEEDGLKSAVLNLGATNLLTKPLKLVDLLAWLRSVLRPKSPRAEHLPEVVRPRGCSDRCCVQQRVASDRREDRPHAPRSVGQQRTSEGASGEANSPGRPDRRGRRCV